MRGSSVHKSIKNVFRFRDVLGGVQGIELDDRIVRHDVRVFSDVRGRKVESGMIDERPKKLRLSHRKRFDGSSCATEAGTF